MLDARAYSPDQLPAMLDFASTNAAQRPGAIYLVPGDIAWREPTSADVRLWYDESGLAGYAWLEPLTGVELDLRHDLPWDGEVATAMLDWSEEKRRALPEAYPRFVDLQSMEEWAEAVQNPRPPAPGDGRWLTISALESDEGRVAALQARSYEHTGHFAPDYRIDLAVEIESPALPPGVTVRHVEATELPERVAVHRDSWIGSSWTLERYRILRDNPAYDPELDLVVDAGDGSFAACCICWADEASGVGFFEPVGTRPAWRGRGVTRALILEGLRRLKNRGMSTARQGTAGFNHPAQAMYESCGFVRTGTARTFMRRLD